jgi:magnesium transporter
MTEDKALDHASREFMVLQKDWTVAQALEAVREKKVPGPIIYFYVADEAGRLVGVLPTRALLVSSLDTTVESLMVKRLVKLPETATLSDASEMFVMYRFLAIPIVDKEQRVVGVIDINAFSDEVLDLAERRNVDGVFETIGLRLSEARDAGFFRAFRLRFPWLTATILGGTACALLASFYGATLEQSIVLAFFLTLVLGLGESVAAQSMTLAVQNLRSRQPTLRWFVKAGGRELATALMLGLACGSVVGLIVLVWHREPLAALTIGGSITGSLVTAALLGLGIPSALHALKLDPRVAAGPLTLALADLATLGIYFNAAWILL